MLRASFFALVALAALAAFAPAFAQDIRGLEVCTAEKAMDRRTSCLQSNVEFLHQALEKQKRDLQLKLDAASREAAAQKAELAALQAELAKLRQALGDLRKSKPDNKTDKK
jgi:septal ring factor EnvC (AmiA/AmiB activator)